MSTQFHRWKGTNLV